MTEEEADNFAPGQASQVGVAIVKKHASLTVGVKSSQSESSIKEASPIEMVGVPSGSAVISQEPVADVKGGSHGPYGKNSSSSIKNGVETPDGDAMVLSTGKKLDGVKNLDKINNLVQKEIALGRVGVTREKAYRVIASALDAKKWMDVEDKQGNVKQEWVDDIEKQRWGAEMAIKMFGDMIERKEIEMDVGDKTLDRLRSLSVAELKARAADLILGKKTMVVEAEVTRV